MQSARAICWLAFALLACAPDAPAIAPQLVVTSRIRMEPAIDGVGVGLDLDGAISTGEGPTCVDRVADLESPSGAPGIDNAMGGRVTQLGMLLGDECPAGTAAADCIDHLLAQRLSAGEQLFAIELTETGELTVHAARPCEGACAPVLTAEGTLAPDQPFVLTPIATGRATIEDGHLRADLDAPIVIVPIETDLVGLFGIHRPRIEATLVEDRLEHAILAGALSRAAIIEDTCRIIAGPCDRDAALAGIADLHPRSTDPTYCEGISITYSLDLVPAQRLAP